MQFFRIQFKLNLQIILLCMIGGLLYGCNTVGPQSIRTSREAYNESVNQTENRQIMMAIVRNRYGEPASMLAVSSIVANIRVTTRVGIDVGIGPSENYASNLVPFSGGFIFEDNPTISYVPVQGERYVRQFMSPVPLDLIVPLARSMGNKRLVFTLLIRSINNLSNPDFLQPPSTGPDLRFMRVVELMTGLNAAGILVWGQDPDSKTPYAIEIHNYAPERVKDVLELLDFLDLAMVAVNSRPIILPVYIALEKPEPVSIAITTRSLHDLFEIISASINIPAEQLSSGMARSFPRPGLPGKGIRIYRSAKQPENASMAVKYRGLWFYIADTDQATKLMFRIIRLLWSHSVTSTAPVQAAPVLTIPVSN